MDLRREPVEVRKATLASFLRKARHGVRLNEHLEHDCGLTVFEHACKMGLEGIVSKRLGSRYRSGRSPDWLCAHTACGHAAAAPPSSVTNSRRFTSNMVPPPIVRRRWG